MAKFIFLQYVDESKSPRPGSPELNAVIDAFAKYLEDVKAAGVYHDGDPCQPSAATFSVTVHGSHAHTTDGPMHPPTPWPGQPRIPLRCSAARSRFTQSSR